MSQCVNCKQPASPDFRRSQLLWIRFQEHRRWSRLSRFRLRSLLSGITCTRITNGYRSVGCFGARVRSELRQGRPSRRSRFPFDRKMVLVSLSLETKQTRDFFVPAAKRFDICLFEQNLRASTLFSGRARMTNDFANQLADVLGGGCTQLANVLGGGCTQLADVFTKELD